MPTDKGINPRGLEDIFGLQLALICGPVEGDPYTDAQLERGWQVYGRELTEDVRDHPRPGVRPWGFWRFEAGQEKPAEHAEVIKILAEMGELTEDERARLAKESE